MRLTTTYKESGSEYGTVVFHLFFTKEDKATRVFYPEYIPWTPGRSTFTIRHLVTDTRQTAYEKISNAILAGVLRDDIECTGIVVTHTFSKLKWEMSFDTVHQSGLVFI
jgi:hypothetical protein